jgi:hypothetical protein
LRWTAGGRLQNFTYLTIDIRDAAASDILSCIPASNIFIEAALNSGGEVLVHWCVRRCALSGFVLLLHAHTVRAVHTKCARNSCTL